MSPFSTHPHTHTVAPHHPQLFHVTVTACWHVVLFPARLRTEPPLGADKNTRVVVWMYTYESWICFVLSPLFHPGLTRPCKEMVITQRCTADCQVRWGLTSWCGANDDNNFTMYIIVTPCDEKQWRFLHVRNNNVHFCTVWFLSFCLFGSVSKLFCKIQINSLSRKKPTFRLVVCTFMFCWDLWTRCCALLWWSNSKEVGLNYFFFDFTLLFLLRFSLSFHRLCNYFASFHLPTYHQRLSNHEKIT